MSNVNSTYLNFDVIDYQNNSDTLSSYNLPITPLVFTPIIPLNYNEDIGVVWDFGDTTKSTEFSPSHTYKLPGTYTVKLFAFNRFNQANLGAISRTVTIKDYIEDNFNVRPSSTFSLSCGAISREIIITQSLPYYYTNSTINYNVSGSRSLDYSKLPDYKYNHLQRYNSLLYKNYIPSSNSYELVEVNSISLPLSNLYVKLVNNTLQQSLTSDSTSTLVGFSGVDTFYYRDDLPTNRFNLSFSRNYDDLTNSLNITFSGNVVENRNITKLSITSNGIDGDSIPLSTFDINPIKFNNTKIHFVIKLKDQLNNTIKNVNPLVLSGAGDNRINISLVGTNIIPVSSYSVNSLQTTLESLSSGGYFRGYVEFTDDLLIPLTGVSISAVAAGIKTLSGTTISGSITGISSPFSIYPQNYYSLYKKGEDFDGEAMYKSLRFQESLLDKNIFFENFLGNIFGDEKPDSQALSKKINERILNFVDNNVNIDTSEIINLISMSQMLDNSNIVFDQNLSNFPNQIQRLISLLSVKRSKLFGVKNKFVENFNSFGHLNNDIYGKNLGNKIDIFSYVVVPGNDIVAYEKFSRKYTLLNTYQPLKGSSFTTTSLDTEDGNELLTESDDIILTEAYYLIKDYNTTWGWPLILPQNFTAQDIDIYYDFYEFNNVYANNYVGGILDMNLTNVDSDDTNISNIYNAIILDTLYQSLSLTSN